MPPLLVPLSVFSAIMMMLGLLVFLRFVLMTVSSFCLAISHLCLSLLFFLSSVFLWPIRLRTVGYLSILLWTFHYLRFEFIHFIRFLADKYC